MNRQPEITFNLYPSLLDAYQDYLGSEDTWLKFWGNSDTPSVTLEEFEHKQFRGLIDRINRVQPAWEDTEKRDRGTAFNMFIDCLVAGKKDETLEIETVQRDNGSCYKMFYNGRWFVFPKTVCAEFYSYFKGAQSQVYAEALLPTQYGNVKLYGFIDELMPTAIHDIKVTGSYEAWKFKDKWQRVVYPYCINESGGSVADFEYNILLITENRGGTYYDTKTEYYNYTEADRLRLTAFVEDFTEFIEQHRELITDKKIFNLLNS
ncbi:MAG: HNH endonuclease [Bacteroidales bacterium]|jgi:hypothetical protein|nr:HNH endonuclease [Bacteroidales bacterium]